MAPQSPPPPYGREKLAQKSPRMIDHIWIVIGPPLIICFDLVAPCIIYYIWLNVHRKSWKRDCVKFNQRGEQCPYPEPEFDDAILGYAIILFGLGELYILLARVWRLLRHPDLCAPLLSRNRYELDATSWVYGVALLVALIPFVVGSTREIPKLYLYSPSILMAFLGGLMLLTLIPFKLPIGVNSQPRGTTVPPFVYYAGEDFVAVDGLQDREFRIRYNERYDSSKGFRRFIFLLTLWWIWGVCVYIGCVSAVIWNLKFHFAFGLSLGVLFGFIIIWAAVTYIWVQIEMVKAQRPLNTSQV